MTVEADIRTALASYSVVQLVRVKYSKPRFNGGKYHLYEIHVEHSADSDIDTIVAALEAMSYKTIVARLASSWPLAGFLYSRFECEITI